MAENRPPGELSSRSSLVGSDRTSKREACNHCKQQKLRCSRLASAANLCSRCQRLGLECKVETGFRRTRKRRRSFELHSEIASLRQQLAGFARDTPNSTVPASAPVVDTLEMPESDLEPSHLVEEQNDQAQPVAFVATDMAASHTAVESSTSTPGTSPDPTEHSNAPGITTKPGIDDTNRNRLTNPIAIPRTLGNITLTVEEIDELFLIYLMHYHPFLPLLETARSPQEYYESSSLLFWVIMAVASRRLHAQPTLLPRLARAVTDLLWRTVRSVPYSLAVVQALALICTWPFPTSSSTADPTFMLVGLMLQIATQMGLHDANDSQDFVKIPLNLTEHEISEWTKTWETCNIVAQSVSEGCGLPILVQQHDWTSSAAADALNLSSSDPNTLHLQTHRRIKDFCQKVSRTLGTPFALESDTPQHRLRLYRLLDAMFLELQQSLDGTTPIAAWFLSAAQLHLQCFYLFDDPEIDGYNERILLLFQTACSLIELSQEMDDGNTKFFNYCPFFCYQSFVCAAFVVLKISKNGFFGPIVDKDLSTKILNAAITSLRAISVTNNDLPARLGEVIGFFCASADPQVIGGKSMEDLRLRNVRNRLSMSITYDSLWIWRKHFRVTSDNEQNKTSDNTPDKYLALTIRNIG